MRAVDFSWARPGGAAIKAAGFDAVIRYVPYPGDGGKGLTREEIEDYRATDLGIALVFESTAARALDNWLGGIQDAKQCETSVAALGFPDDLPIYFAVDFDAQESDFGAIDMYLLGAAAVLGSGRVGVYGSYTVIEHCAETEFAKWFWQALAWSGGRHSGWRHIYQSLNGQEINGGAVDYNETVEDFGQWMPPKGEDMTPQEVEAIVRRVFDEEFPGYYRSMTKKYWVDGMEGDYSDRPDPDVAGAIFAFMGDIRLDVARALRSLATNLIVVGETIDEILDNKPPVSL